MCKSTIWIQDWSAHSVQSDLELCLLQKPIYMYVQASGMDSGSECDIRLPQKPTFNCVYTIHKNILFKIHSKYTSFHIFFVIWAGGLIYAE